VNAHSSAELLLGVYVAADTFTRLQNQKTDWVSVVQFRVRTLRAPPSRFMLKLDRVFRQRLKPVSTHSNAGPSPFGQELQRGCKGMNNDQHVQAEFNAEALPLVLFRRYVPCMRRLRDIDAC
jgi:hypothetical protein